MVVLAVGLGQDADALVVADSRRLEAEALGELADGERCVVHEIAP